MAEPLNIKQSTGNPSDWPASDSACERSFGTVNGKLDMTNTSQMEEFVYSEEDLILAGPVREGWRYNGREMRPNSRFDLALRTGWVEKMKMGLFRYNLGDLQTRILPGAFKFVAQLNIQRGLERRKPQDIQSVQQRFNSQQFNFNKIHPEEILFQITSLAIRKEPYLNLKLESQGSKSQKTYQPKGDFLSQSNLSELCDGRSVTLSRVWKSNVILAVINVSPLEFGHVLFIPDPTLCLPQILTPDLIQFGIESVLLSAHPGFRVGFNSLGGLASVNHLHLHGFYLDHKLCIESTCTEPLRPEVNFHLLSDFPARGFLFHTGGSALDTLAHNIHKVTHYLVEKNIAHNLFVTRGWVPGNLVSPESRAGTRIIIWARKSCFGIKEETAFNVALCELAGHLPIKNTEDFHSITEASAVAIIQKYLLPEEEFSQLTAELVKLFAE